MTPSKCYLDKIPTEILVSITDSLTTPEFGYLRRTCKTIENKLDSFFTREFFTKKQFLVHPFSLQVLIDIANSRLGPYLRQVYLATNIPQSYTVYEERTPPNTDNDNIEEVKRQRAAYAYSFYEEFQTMWATGQHVHLLSTAFAALPNLEGVMVRNDAASRPRDGRSARWDGYGSRTVSQRSGHRLFHEENNSGICLAVLIALGAAEAKPTTFEILLRGRCAIDNTSVRIPKTLLPSVIPMLNGLKKLHLFVGYKSEPCSGDMSYRRLLHHTPNLEDLRINGCGIQYGETLDRLDDFYKWLAKTPDPEYIMDDNDLDDWSEGAIVRSPPPVELPHLRKLSLGSHATWPTVVLQLIQRWPKLEDLDFWRLTLRLTDAEHNDKVNPWADVAEKITTFCPELHHVKIGEPTVGYARGAGRMNVFFTNIRQHNRMIVTYDGIDCKSFLLETAKKMGVNWPTNTARTAHIYLQPHQVHVNAGDDEDEDNSEDEDASDGSSELAD